MINLRAYRPSLPMLTIFGKGNWGNFLRERLLANLLQPTNKQLRYFEVNFCCEGLYFQTFKMATGKTDSSIMFGGSKLSSLEDDFTHGVTVAQTNIKIRLGLYFRVSLLYFKPQKAVHVTLIRHLGSSKSKVINVRNSLPFIVFCRQGSF